MGDIERLYSVFSRLERWFAALFSSHTELHPARFASPKELSRLTTTHRDDTSLLLAKGRFNQVFSVQPVPGHPELGNMLVVARTRGGKGLLATAQLLSWPHSAVVNDIKGELYEQTAGYRSRLGPVFGLGPGGVGHRLDPLAGREAEDKLLSSATQLLLRGDEGEGRIFTERAIVMLTQLFLAARLEGQAPLPLCAPDGALGLDRNRTAPQPPRSGSGRAVSGRCLCRSKLCRPLSPAARQSG